MSLYKKKFFKKYHLLIIYFVYYKLIFSRDEEDDYSYRLPDVCYFIVGGDVDAPFNLDSISHELTTTRALDREAVDAYSLVVRSTEDCHEELDYVDFFDANNDALLAVEVSIADVDDSPPVFVKKVFDRTLLLSSRIS